MNRSRPRRRPYSAAAVVLVAWLACGLTIEGQDLFQAPRILSSPPWPAAMERSSAQFSHASLLTAETLRFRRMTDGAYVARHGVQGLALRVTGGGLDVVGDSMEDRPWYCRIRTQRYGCGAQFIELMDGEAAAAVNEVSLRRGPVVEWFWNTPEGVRQEWLLLEAPSDAASDEVWLSIEVGGDLVPTPGERDDRALLVTSDGLTRLEYGGLAAWDATGRQLAVGLVVGEGALQVVIDASHARYPIWVDPLVSVPSRVLASEQAMSWTFGRSLATVRASGDRVDDLVVGEAAFGSPASGRVLLYVGSAQGLGDSPAWTTLGTSFFGSGFGHPVAPGGDLNGDGHEELLVGCVGGGTSLEGQAFTYAGSATFPSTPAIWMGAGGQMDSNYGRSLAGLGDIDGDGLDDMVVGAPQDGGGAFFVYRGSPTGPEATPHFTVQSPVWSQLGWPVARAGDVNGDGFADLLVGDWAYPDGANAIGRVWLYHGSSTGLLPTPAWIVDAPPGEFTFGFSVTGACDLNNDGFIDVVVASGFGQTWAYHGSTTGLSTPPDWQGAGKVTCTGDFDGDGYDDLATGDHNHAGDSGIVRVYLGGPTGLATVPVWTVAGSSPNYRLGTALAVGDYNDDGLDDLAVSAQGLVHVYLTGGPSFRRGDSNDDAQYNLADAIFTLAYLFVPTSQSPACAKAADSNDDGTLNVADAVHTLSALFGGAPAPPSPGPQTCGPDPTQDGLTCVASACP